MRHRWMIVVPVFGFALVGTAPLEPVRADCISNCSSFYNPLTNPNNWQSLRNDCVLRCPPQRSKTTTAYGALAYGTESTAWGFSYNQDSADAAARVALEGCKPNGDDCKVVYHFYNTCAALAAVEDKGVFATAYAATRGKAEGAAMADCARQYGDGCVMEVSTCSLP